MPRKKSTIEDKPRSLSGNLSERLANELRNSHVSGQPVIDEQDFPSGKSRVTVVWDDWEPLSFEDRTTVILRAYELAEGRESRDRIALASGLTVPEAYAAGMLPFQVIAAVREGDAVSREDCRKAMIDEGASLLWSPDKAQLRFATLAEAEAAQHRLAQRLPNSEPVWIVVQDVGRVEDWASQ